MRRHAFGVAVALAGAVGATAFAQPSEGRRAECAARATALVERLTGEERVRLLMMDSPAVLRLGIDAYHWWNEALHGVARAGKATVFPQSIGLAATFDTELERRIGDAVSTEARAKYNLFRRAGRRGIYEGLTFWSPNVNMFRDPRWGRGQETFGEDPFLSGAIGAAFVRGMQGNDPRYLKTAACAKHFAVHSGPERKRYAFDARVTPRDLREYYLPAFRTLVVDAEVESVMGAYNAFDDVPCCASRFLLTDVLRGEWGFKGHVVSDVGAVKNIYLKHHYRTNCVEGCRAAMAAGLDLCSESTYGCLDDAVRDGRMSADEMKLPLQRLLTTRMLLGQFDPLGSTPWDALDERDVATAANRELALRAAEESIVLISNNGALPLDPGRLNAVCVTGPFAGSLSVLKGNYCGYTSEAVTCEEGLVDELGAGVRVLAISPGEADAVVACIGISPDDEGEASGGKNTDGDRVRYGIGQGDIDWLHRLRGQCKAPLIAVVFGGSPIDLAPIVACCDAVMVVWYPGEQGGRAIARTVLGRSNPSGRLPVTYPKSYGDLPPFDDYALEGRTYLYAEGEPLYPFGYGLSYTSFEYANPRVEPDRNGVRVSVEVTNTGSRPGDEVVQAYIRAPGDVGDRRRHHLEGFVRVSLRPGETRRVEIPLPFARFAVFGPDGTLFVPKGRSTVFVGGGQPGFASVMSVQVDLSGCQPGEIVK